MKPCGHLGKGLYAMFSCVIVTFPYVVLGQVWYLNVSLPDLCLLPYSVQSLMVYVDTCQTINIHATS